MIALILYLVRNVTPKSYFLPIDPSSPSNELQSTNDSSLILAYNITSYSSKQVKLYIFSYDSISIHQIVLYSPINLSKADDEAIFSPFIYTNIC